MYYSSTYKIFLLKTAPAQSNDIWHMQRKTKFGDNTVDSRVSQILHERFLESSTPRRRHLDKSEYFRKQIRLTSLVDFSGTWSPKQITISGGAFSWHPSDIWHISGLWMIHILEKYWSENNSICWPTWLTYYQSGKLVKCVENFVDLWGYKVSGLDYWFLVEYIYCADLLPFFFLFFETLICGLMGGEVDLESGTTIFFFWWSDKRSDSREITIPHGAHGGIVRRLDARSVLRGCPLLGSCWWYHIKDIPGMLGLATLTGRSLLRSAIIFRGSTLWIQLTIVGLELQKKKK